MDTLIAFSMARWLRGLGLAVTLVLLNWGANAQELAPVPPLTAHMMDRTGTLGPSQIAAIDAKLIALEAAKGSQVVVLMVSSARPEDIASYANRVGNEWKIGRKAVGDGLLLLIAKEDHDIRIEVTKTLEGAVPDLLAKRIIDQAITPRFKLGDYAGGIDAGVDQISAAIRGEPLPEVAVPSPGGAGMDWMNLGVFMFVLVPIVGAIARGIFGRGPGALLTGGGIAALVFFITASLWLALGVGVVALIFSLLSGVALPTGRGGPWGGGGFGSGGGLGGGGGFSSGGGGDFGGGGASGKW